MPEFRFRRKKHQNRRHTLHNPDETSKQVKAAKQQISEPVKQDKPGGREKRNSLVQEREKFFELLKNKYPEQANDLEVQQVLSNGEEGAGLNSRDETFGIEDLDDHTHIASNGPIDFSDEAGIITTTSSSMLPSIKASVHRRISNTFHECLFLQYGKSLRRCPMPSPITLSTIKNLYVNMFDISPQVLEDPHCIIYIRHKDKRQWEELQNVSLIADHCTLLLVDTPNGHAPSQYDSDINMPLSGNSQRSQGSGGSGNSQVVLETAGSGTTPTGKLNGLWQSGRCQEVEDLTKLSDNLPIHPLLSHAHSNGDTTTTTTTTMTSPFSVNSSTSGVYSDPPVDTKKLASRAKTLQTSVSSLKKELGLMRKDHLEKMADFSHSLEKTSHRLSAAVSAILKTGGIGSNVKGVESFRQERMELYGLKEGYDRCAKKTHGELIVLERAVEDMRVDVVQRRCRVDGGELESLTLAVSTLGKSVEEIKGLYEPLEVKMKGVMEKELETIVREENYLREEGPRIKEALTKQKKLESTLTTLMQFATVQSHRTPLIPYFAPIPEPDRETLIQNIKAITPNHTHRVECLELSETIQLKKKELYSPATKRIKKFENQLQIQRGHLQHRDVATVEDGHLRNVKVWFLEEKREREKKNEQEFERLMKLDAKKRDKERKQMEELWRQQHMAREKADKVKARQLQSHESVLKTVQQQGSSNVNQATSGWAGRRGSDGPFQMSRSDDRLLESGNVTHFNGFDGHSHMSHGRSTTFHATRSDERLLDSGVPRRPTNTSLHTRTHSDDQTHHSSQSSSSSRLYNRQPKSIKLRPVPKGRNLKKMPQADLSKRKSIGYLGEFEDLQVHYDSLQEKQLGGGKSDGKLRHISTTSQSSFSSSSSSKHIPAGSMTTTTSRGSGSSGRGMGGVSNAYYQQQQHHHQSFNHSQPQSGTRDGMGMRHKHPKMNGFPTRYSMYEHHSQPTSESSHGGGNQNNNGTSANSLSQPAEPESELFRHEAFVSHSRDKSKRRTSGQQSTRGVPLRSNSDDSLFEYSTVHPQNNSHQQHTRQDVSSDGNTRWAMDIFTSDTLPVSKEKRQLLKQDLVAHSNRTTQQQRLHRESSKVRSPANESVKVIPTSKQPTFHHSYTQVTQHSTPPRSGNGSNPMTSSFEKTAPTTTNSVSHSNKSRSQYHHSEPHQHQRHHQASSASNSHRHRHTLTSNTAPTHTVHAASGGGGGGHRQTVNLPIRPTKSAQIPSTHQHITSDTQLTSYPRSYTAAMNSMHMRSTSNGRPLPVGGSGNMTVPPSGGRSNVLYKPHHHHGHNRKGELQGSLV